MVYRALLSGDEREVLEAGSGEEALEILKGADISLIVTDCQMPGMGGLEMVRRIREQYSEMPVIVVSSTADPADFEPLMPRAIMSKPFRLTDLMAAVQDVLEESVES